MGVIKSCFMTFLEHEECGFLGKRGATRSGIMSQERIAPVSRMSQSGNYGNCGALARSGAEMDRGSRELRILGSPRDGNCWASGAGFTPPDMAFDEASEYQCEGGR